MTRMKFVLCAASLCGAATFARLAWTQDNLPRTGTTVVQETTGAVQPVQQHPGTGLGAPNTAPGFAPGPLPGSGGFPGGGYPGSGVGPMRPRTVTRYVNEVIYEKVSEQEALDAKKLQEALHALKTSTDEAAKKKATETIQEQLAKQFERDLSQREKELAAVEERVKSLRQQLDKRKTAKDDIISLRLKTIINNAEGLGFPGDGGVSESPLYGTPSFNPVVPRVPGGNRFLEEPAADPPAGASPSPPTTTPRPRN